MIDAPKYKDYILPMIFLKRLSDVFEDEIIRLAIEFGDKTTVERLIIRIAARFLLSSLAHSYHSV